MDINKLMQQAQEMQRELEKTAEEIKNMEFEGSASNGLVKVMINGDNRVVAVTIDPSILNPEDKEMIEDLIMIATNEASDKLDEERTNRLGMIQTAKGLF